MTAKKRVDPARLMFLAPVISSEEDWRERSLVSWVTMASHEGVEARRTEAGGKGFSGSWCGNVAVEGLVYRVHRAPRLRMSMLNDADQQTWALYSATYVEPVTQGVEVIDPRDHRSPSGERTVHRPGEVEDHGAPDLRTVDLPEAPPPHETGRRDTAPEPGG